MAHFHPLAIEFNHSADLDIAEILDFTLEKFGSKQRLIYKHWIDQAVERIATAPDLGKDTDIYPYLRYNISWAGNKGSHCLYYYVKGNTLVIARVLHQSRVYNTILN